MQLVVPAEIDATAGRRGEERLDRDPRGLERLEQAYAVDVAGRVEGLIGWAEHAGRREHRDPLDGRAGGARQIGRRERRIAAGRGDGVDLVHPAKCASARGPMRPDVASRSTAN